MTELLRLPRRLPVADGFGAISSIARMVNVFRDGSRAMRTRENADVKECPHDLD